MTRENFILANCYVMIIEWLYKKYKKKKKGKQTTHTQQADGEDSLKIHMQFDMRLN